MSRRRFHRGALPWLPALLQARHCYLDTRGLSKPATGWGRPQLVLSRSLCVFGRFDFEQVPLKNRAAALRLRLRGWAPYASPDYAVAWQQGQALVWSWDSARVARLLEQHGPANQRWGQPLPETALTPAMPDGLHLLAMMEGFEGQQWRGGSLQASRWWPQTPDAAQWLAFQRDCAVPPDAQAEVPPAQRPTPLAQPALAVGGLAAAQGDLLRWEGYVYAGAAALLLAGAAVLGLREWQWQQALQVVRARTSQLQQESAPLIQARETALQSAERVSAVLALQRYPDPLQVLAALAERLPDDGTTLREFEIGDGKARLLLVSSSGAIAGARQVEMLESTGLFNSVKMVTQADPKAVGYILELRPLRATSERGRAASNPP